jgi:hypothetical protein
MHRCGRIPRIIMVRRAAQRRRKWLIHKDFLDWHSLCNDKIASQRRFVPIYRVPGQRVLRTTASPEVVNDLLTGRRLFFTDPI